MLWGWDLIAVSGNASYRPVARSCNSEKEVCMNSSKLLVLFVASVIAFWFAFHKILLVPLPTGYFI
jgi:hypothetical protein